MTTVSPHAVFSNSFLLVGCISLHLGAVAPHIFLNILFIFNVYVICIFIYSAGGVICCSSKACWVSCEYA